MAKALSLVPYDTVSMGSSSRRFERSYCRRSQGQAAVLLGLTHEDVDTDPSKRRKVLTQ